MSKPSLSHLVFREDSNFAVRLFVQDLETTYLTHFSGLLAGSKTRALKIEIQDSSIWSEFLQGYPLDFIKASLSKIDKLSQVYPKLVITLGHQFNLPFPVRCLPVSHLPFPFWCQTFPSTILIKNAHPPFSTTHLPFFISLL